MPEIERRQTTAADKLLFGKYEVGRLLGCGAFAKVYHAREAATGRSVALKVINKKRLLSSNAGLAANVKREVAIMRRLRHPNIVRLHEVSATRGRVCFVMEFVKGGELFARVAKGRFSEDLARGYFRQLISAVGYCHSRGVFHRDLKPENLLVDDLGNLKVSDFGLSAVAADQVRSDGLLHTLCGTPAYVAPEILAKRGYDGACVDVWSCGVVLFVLTAGYLPFNDPNLMALYRKIYGGEYRCPKWMSPDLRRFLARMLETDPEKRITVDGILRDPWFCKGGYDGAAGMLGEAEKDDDDDDDDDEEGEREGLAAELNAFDIISFSSGLDLSGLFGSAAAERVVARGEPRTAAEAVEGFAAAEGMSARRKKNGAVVVLEGQNGNLVVRVGFYRLGDGLVVAEAKRKAGDSSAYSELWRDKLRPLLAGI